jgi:TolB protein
VATPRDGDKSGGAIPLVVRADLERSEMFRMLPTGAGLDERSTSSLAEWRTKGARCAGGRLGATPGRRAPRRALQAVGGTVKGEDLLGRSNVVPGADLRLAAHRIADESHEKLTGERGRLACLRGLRGCSLRRREGKP